MGFVNLTYAGSKVDGSENCTLIMLCITTGSTRNLLCDFAQLNNTLLRFQLINCRSIS